MPPVMKETVRNKANSHPAGRHGLHVTLGDSLHRARGVAQIIGGVSSRMGVSPRRTGTRTDLSVSA